MVAKKRTVKVLVPRSDNARAQRIYLITIGLLIWANSIPIIAIIIQIGKRLIDPEGSHTDLDPIAAVLFITVFVSLVVGLTAILKIHPPFHYLVSFGAAVNLVVSFFAGPYGYIQGLASVVLLYIGIRFPITFEYEKKILK